MKKKYVRYRLILESEVAGQPIDNGTNRITGHSSMAVDSRMRQGNLSDEQAIKLLKTAGKVITATATVAAKIAWYVLKTLSAPIGRWIRDCISGATDLAIAILRGACKDFIAWIFDWIGRLVKNLWGLTGKAVSYIWAGFAGICCALLEPFKHAITKMLKGKPNEGAYTTSFRPSRSIIKILNESSNDPGMIRRILNKIIGKSKDACRSLYDLCVKNDVVKKNPKLAGMVGLSTILICGHPDSSAQPINSPNGTAVVGAN